jgi:acetyl esterase/lipase
MDRRSVLGLGAAAIAAASAGGARAADPVPTSDRLAGDPSETVGLWPGTPPGGEKLHLDLQLLERSETPDLFHDRFVTDVSHPLLTVFRPKNPDGSALLIAPGGAYLRVVIDKEGFEAARRVADAGVTAFVLRYRLPGEGWENAPDVPLQDAQRALRIIRGRAADFGVDPKRIGILGFSAGGHLAASLLTRSAEQVYAPVDTFDAYDARPDFAGLMYPVLSMVPPVAHAASREKLLGAHPTEAQELKYSPERHVVPGLPPVFIALAADDPVVPPQNSLDLLGALRAAKVPVDFHMFGEGGHGFGLRLAQGKPASIWPELFLRWGASHAMFRSVTV